MFGFGNNTPSLGTNTFGSNTFGQPTFGQPAATPSATPAFGTSTFGSTPAFGQPAAAPSTGFGASTFGTTQPSTFGAPSSTSTGFGAPSFGSTQPSTTFGQPSTGFGSTPAFGGATTTPAFGTTTTTSTFGSTPSIFGNTSASSTPFGMASATPSTGSMFGTPQSAAPSTGLFGASTTAASPFGASTFGSTPSTNTGFGAFGGNTAAATPAFGMGTTTQGTGNPPYKTTPETDQSTGSVFQQTAVTAMPQYAMKSFEELRWEDYQAKKHQTGGGFGGSSFSTASTFGASAAPSGSLFGSTATPSPFGASAATTTPAFGAFGNTAPSATASSSVFGSTTSTPSVFGGSTASPFGASPATSAPAFGSSTTTPSLFGGASATPSPFGASSTPAPTSTGFGFGSTTTPSPFGSATSATPAFGATSASTTSSPFSFGMGSSSAAPSTSTPFSFGGASAQPAATGATGSTGLFGSTPSASAPTTSLFGGSSTLFPSTSSTPSATGTSFSLPSFGGSSTTSASTPSLFPSMGTTSTASPSTGFLQTPSLGSWSSSTATQPASSFSAFSPLGAATPGQLKQATLTSQPFGPMPSITVSPATSTSSTGTPSTPQVKKPTSTPSHYKLTPRSAAKIKPRGYSKSKLPIFEDTSQPTGAAASIATPDLFTPRSSIKKLVIDTTEDDDYYEHAASSTPSAATPVNRSIDRPAATPLSPRSQDAASPMSTGSLYPKLPEAIGRSPERTISSYTRASNLPTLTKPGYYTIPDISELAEMDAASLRAIPNFVVGCEGVGCVEFIEPTDVRGLDLDKIVEFKHREITIYPDDHNKPRVGEGLNKPAIVTLDKVWPIDKASKQIKVDKMSLEKYQQKLEKTTENYGARFLAYDQKTGSWSFQVEHFSRYGIDEDDDEDTETPTPIVEEIPNTSISEAAPPVETLPSPNRFSVDADLDDDQDYYQDDYETQYPGSDATYEVDDYLPQTETDTAMETIPEPVLPKQLGLNTAKMQVMKSLLFEPAGSTENDYKFYDPFRPPAEMDTPLTFSPATPTSDIASTSMLSPLSTSVLFPSHPFQKPTSSGLKRIGMADSVTFHREKQINDAALFMGRSFRAGWSHSGKFVRLGGNSATSFSVITVEQLFVPTNQEANVMNQYLPLLQMHRNSTQQSVDINVGPGVKLESATDNIQSFEIVDINEAINKHIMGFNEILTKSSNEFLKHLLKNAVLLFELLRALWGDESSSKSIINTNSVKNQEQPDSIREEYKENLARRTALSEWLKKAIQTSIASTDNHEIIFQLLTSKRILEAATLAQQIGDFRLSTLIAQSNSLIKEDLQNQLAVWDKSAETNFIDKSLLRIYQLLAGKMNGDVLGGLDWKRCFGVHLWFGCGRTNSIADVLEQYDKSTIIQNASYPLPEWLEGIAEERPSEIVVLEDNTLLAIRDKKVISQKVNSSGWQPVNRSVPKSRVLSVIDVVPDTDYHLLRLFADRSYSTWQVLSQSSWTPYALDCRVSWHLFTVLHHLGYPCPRMVHSLFSDYALQLEINGLWTWAVYVWLNLPYQSFDTFRIRNEAIKDIISRHSWNMTREDEAFLQTLKIPQKWIHEARSWVACYQNDIENQIVLLIRSQQWVEAHKLIVDIVAPETIAKTISLSSNFTGIHVDSLLDLLQQIAPHANEVVDWNIGGSIYLDFIKLANQYKTLLQQLSTNKNAKWLAQLEQQCLYAAERLSSLANKIQQRTDGTNKENLSQRIAVSDMSTHTAEMLIGIRDLISRENATVSSQLDTNSMKNMIQIFDIMKTLPIPDDFYHKLMRNVTETFVV